MTSSRKIGDDFEEIVLEAINSSNKGHTFLGFRKTAGSGSKFMDGDIRHKDLVIECKVKGNTSGFSSPQNELKKLWKEAAKHLKYWLYFVKNKDNKEMVLMDLETFLELTEDWRIKNSE
jgi:hypothetical protein